MTVEKCLEDLHLPPLQVLNYTKIVVKKKKNYIKITRPQLKFKRSLKTIKLNSGQSKLHRRKSALSLQMLKLPKVISQLLIFFLPGKKGTKFCYINEEPWLPSLYNTQQRFCILYTIYNILTYVNNNLLTMNIQQPLTLLKLIA